MNAKTSNEPRYMAFDRDGWSIGVFRNLADLPAETHRAARVWKTTDGNWQRNTSDGYYYRNGETYVKVSL